MALVTNSGGATDKLDFELSYLSKMLLLAGDWPPALPRKRERVDSMGSTRHFSGEGALGRGWEDPVLAEVCPAP
jgi:hypothetical protein